MVPLAKWCRLRTYTKSSERIYFGVRSENRRRQDAAAEPHGRVYAFFGAHPELKPPLLTANLAAPIAPAPV
jgi:hypothetical protein